MQVRNILINNREVFEEELIRELIKRNISYVQIEHEFHFLDNIIRFIEPKQDKDIILDIILEEPKLELDSFILEEQFEEIKKEVPTYKMNKKLLKQINRQTNSKINTKKK